MSVQADFVVVKAPDPPVSSARGSSEFSSHPLSNRPRGRQKKKTLEDILLERIHGRKHRSSGVLFEVFLFSAVPVKCRVLKQSCFSLSPELCAYKKSKRAGNMDGWNDKVRSSKRIRGVDHLGVGGTILNFCFQFHKYLDLFPSLISEILNL